MDKASFTIALVICTYNRDKYLPQALESIKDQTFDKRNFQLIIVDNNSTDSTAAISKKFIADNPAVNVKYCFEANKGLSFARNRGWTEASARIICYVDDDAILSPGYLTAMDAFFKSTPSAVGVGGKVIPKYEHGTAPAWMNKYLNGFVGRVDFGEESKIFDEGMKYPAGCNMTYTRDVIEQAGGFNNELTFRSDDKYMFFKVKEISDQVYYVPNACVNHYIDDHRLTLQNFRKLFLKTGNEEKIRVRKEKGSIAVLRKFVEYTVKFGASLALYTLFILKGKEIQGRYVLYSQWFTLKGFLSKTVFVR